jgi:hypothetical protein
MGLPLSIHLFGVSDMGRLRSDILSPCSKPCGNAVKIIDKGLQLLQGICSFFLPPLAGKAPGHQRCVLNKVSSLGFASPRYPQATPTPKDPALKHQSL